MSSSPGGAGISQDQWLEKDQYPQGFGINREVVYDILNKMRKGISMTAQRPPSINPTKHHLKLTRLSSECATSPAWGLTVSRSNLINHKKINVSAGMVHHILRSNRDKLEPPTPICHKWGAFEANYVSSSLPALEKRPGQMVCASSFGSFPSCAPMVSPPRMPPPSLVASNMVANRG